MNKSFDWFGLAPYGAGSPPAFVLALNLYKSVMTVVSPSLWVIGAFVAGVGVVSMMAVEVGTYKMLARAVADKERRAAILAGIGAFVVTGFIIFSVYSGTDTRSLFSSTAIMLVGYLALMLREYLERKKANAQREADEIRQAEATQTQNQIALLAAQAEADRVRLEGEAELERQRTAQKRADARAAKAAVTSGQAGRPLDATGQEKNLDPVKLAWVRKYYENPDNADKSAASMIGEDGCPFASRETARIYKAAVKAGKK